MNAEQWRQVDRIFHGALKRAPAERELFIEAECAGDSSLLGEVKTLIVSYERAGGFLDPPAWEAALLPRETIAPGTRVGAYEVRSIIGAGGMGEVYRAHDTALKRDVAIKVLADVFADNPDRVGRFRREAEVLAKLNHPNIAAIYGLEGMDGRQALILELVEGRTLADRVAQGPIPFGEALAIARQVAEAIEAAHKSGIIHRDLKPSNIKITPDGKVKVLDFGLAKVGAAEATGGVNLSHSTGVMSTPGMIMGTVAYMAPEQARGKAVDKRADIWAFGCVLYEMLTGRAPFARETVTDSLAAILERDPNWSALPATVPANIERMLRHCLEKDLQPRMSDIAEARIEIEKALSPGTHAPAKSVLTDRHRLPVLRWSSVVVALLVAFVALGALAWKVLESKPEGPGKLIIASAGATKLTRANLRSLAITPDATRVVYLGPKNTIYVDVLGQYDPKPLYTGSAPVNYLFVSYDGQWTGFVEGKTLKRVSMSRTVEPIFRSDDPSLGAAWAPDDTIIFADADPETGLKRVPVGGGTPTLLTSPKPEADELDHVWPEMLPDGHNVLFTITTKGGNEATRQLAVLNLETKVYDRLMVSGHHAHYVSSGHLVYAAGGALWAVAFDSVSLKTSGKPREVLPRVVVSRQGSSEFDVAAGDGTIAYVDAPDERLASGTLMWVYPGGREIPLLDASEPPRKYVHPRLSPDKKQLAVSVVEENKGIWILDLANKSNPFTPFTIEDGTALWLDNKNLAYFTPGVAGLTLLRRPTDRSVMPEPLGIGPPTAVTRDGRVLFSPTGRGISAVTLDGTRRTVELLSDSTARNGVQSPDGRWLAFQSRKSGKIEIYMAEFANPNGTQWPISSGGDNTRPLFSPDGKRLFYVASDGALMEAPLSPQGGLSGKPKPIVPGEGYLNLGLGGTKTDRTYDFDGERFLMVRRARTDQDRPTQIIILTRWSEELKRLVPAKP